ncbi:MAG TPA: helix-turn-helix domain-containing protein [Rhizomicrobium sp.]|nr:helix-turn-helix domain-containing protein [Rhizomicrobium sp.]
MVTSRQFRAARALLGWTQQTLADKALVAINTVRAIEADRAYPIPRPDSIISVRHALERAGIVFLSNGTMGEGVRFAKSPK